MSRSPTAGRRPNANQFGLRDLLILTTATCGLCAALSAAGLRGESELCGLGVIPAFAFAAIAVIEAVRRLLGETRDAFWKPPALRDRRQVEAAWPPPDDQP